MSGLVEGERKTLDLGGVCRTILPYVYQVSKEECLNLPPKTYRHVSCPFSPEQTRLYQVIKYRFLERVRSESNDPSRLGMEIYRLFCGLHAVSCGLVPAGFSGGRRVENRRVSLLIELLRNIKTSHMIVWTNHRESIFALNEGLTESLPWLRSHMLFGGLSPGVRTQRLDKWREAGGVLLATQGTGGAPGLTLTEADHVFFFSENWKYSLRIQAEDRSHRIGTEAQSTLCHHTVRLQHRQSYPFRTHEEGECS